MADTWDNAEMGGPVGEVEDSQPQQIQEKKINKKKLAELEPNGKMLQVFIRDPITRAVVPCTAIKDVPRDVATICSDFIYKKVVNQGESYLILDGSHGVAPYKFVFDWIKTCGIEQSVASAPEVKDLIDDKTGMKPFIDAMVVAHKLQIPYASFGRFMVRKLLPLARDHLVDLDTVRKAYDSGDEVFNELDIRELCVKSIFEHWFAWKLDGDEEWKLDYMCTLEEMRKDMPDLDEDLHKAVDDKNQWLTESRKKRREQEQQANEEAGAAGDADGGNNAWAGYGAEAAAGGSGEDAWANQGVTASGGGEDWMNNNSADAAVVQGQSDWAGEDDTSADPGTGINWADDINADSQPAQNFTPAPIAAGGW